MRNDLRTRFFLLGCAAVWLGCASVRAQSPFSARVLADGLKEPHGVAIHPVTGDIYVSEKGSGKILILKNGRTESALAPDWAVSTNLPRWAISTQIPR